MMFGHVMRLCHDSIKDHGGDPFWFKDYMASSYVLTWKFWLHREEDPNYISEALLFTAAGWHRDWAISFQSPAPSIRSCSVLRGNRATNRKFPFQWRRYQLLPEYQ